jgi:peroxiredoxin family protein
MSRLQPYQNEDEITQEIEALLVEDKVIPAKSAKMDMDDIRDAFDQNGASVKDVAIMTGNIMKSGAKEEIKIRAAELAMKVHGVFKEMDEKPVPVINITIVGENNQTMVNLLCPR